MNIAIIGAGFAGLAVAWFALQKGDRVTVFDQGEGASLASTGLLHPYPGREAKLSWQAEEGMSATKELLEVAGKDTFVENGLVRFAVTEEQQRTYGPSPVPKVVGKAKEFPEGITVFSRRYLANLRKACSKADFIDAHVEPDALHEYDAIIVAGGAKTLQWPGCGDLELKCNIGQMLICRWKEKLPMSLLGHGHITPTEDPELCQVGSTYEHGKHPEREKALALIEKVAQFYPPAREFAIVDVRSGVRIAPKMGYRPIVQKVGKKTWVCTGFGSRGLLYHALMAKSLMGVLR
jgi:glycine/D-amino acid oxidase-like deaminating enzyme